MMYSTLVFIGCAGLLVSPTHAAETPVTLEPSVGQVEQRAHIYFNTLTGERVVTLLEDAQTQGADATSGSTRIWSTHVQNACASTGYTTEYFFEIDDPDGYTLSSSGMTLLDYGDIEKDTVVDCIQVNWVTAHPDTDLDSDGVGDGVEEFAGEWIIWDADNGRASCIRTPIISVLLTDLPGHLGNPGILSGYTLEVDLVGGFSGTNLSFEIGDSDGDCQTAAFCNSNPFGDGPIANGADRDFDGLPDSDLDGDGLFDWAWSLRFYHPAMGLDLDSDGDSGTASPFGEGVSGVSFGFPEGSAVDNGDGTWTWAIDTSVVDAGTGEEDRFVLYNRPTSDGSITYNGGYWFGGFACSGGLIGSGGVGYTPPAMFQFALYGVGGACDNPADTNGDGELNFFDVSAFIVSYLDGADYNGDGQTDYFDVSVFVQDYHAGCP